MDRVRPAMLIAARVVDVGSRGESGRSNAPRAHPTHKFQQIPPHPTATCYATAVRMLHAIAIVPCLENAHPMRGAARN